MSRLPIVAVVGRPNVGKSTLINRIIGRRSAVVEERPGVTRDRREFVADWSGRQFLLIDTGGWQVAGDELATDISGQAEAALASADVVLFVLDASTSIADDDLGVAALLRSTPDRVVVVANKVDDAARELDIAELWSLGLGEPIPISALHGRGTGDLLDRLVERLPALDRVPETDPLPRLAIVGRPNVGKSTLLNQLLKDERVLVSPVPGTTRDPIDAVVALGGVQYNIVDTAGIRRAPKVKEDTEWSHSDSKGDTNGRGDARNGGGPAKTDARPAEAAPEPDASVTTIDASSEYGAVAAGLDRSNAALQGDAPACDVCGSITVRNGTCYKCLNCGNSMGCS